MSAKTKTQRFKRLISHGFFAPELPPCFISHDLARYRQYIWSAIEALPAQPGTRSNGAKQFISEPSWFYFPRYGRDDRKHGVINPVSYLSIAKVVSDNFINLRAVAQRSNLSTSPLIFDWAGNRALFRPGIDLRDDFRIDLATRHDRYATADVRAFFHSVYTHAIPWAIYGKTWAKENRQNNHYGNLLDLYCRNAQDGQTIGLPVGPDTSRLIAEVIASAMDVKITKQLGLTTRDASRYVDDYTIAVEPNLSGDGVISAVRQAAASFELELNNDKSKMQSTSLRPPTGWKQTALAHVPKTDRSTNNFLRFFYEVGRICSEHPDLNVEKFAFQNARSSFVNAENWKGIQSHLINAYCRNSTLVSFVVEVLILRQVEHQDVDAKGLRVFLERRLSGLARENRSGEIIWLLLLVLRIEINISAEKIAPVFELENSMVALMVTFACARGFIQGQVDHSIWNNSLTSKGLHSQMWLYAYESVRNGTNPNADRTFIEKNPFFAPLLRKNIQFFEPNEGFNSIASTLRNRRGENARAQVLRDDFLDDFDFELDEFDEDDGEDIQDYEFDDEY